jgi:hypothetical protein
MTVLTILRVMERVPCVSKQNPRVAAADLVACDAALAEAS